jgi:hypothetical protein
VDGLAEFSRNLKKLDADLPKALRLALNQAADVVVDYARPLVPRRTGRAARSVAARSTRTAVRVVAGGKRAPYYPWLDFGGRVGRGRSVVRPFLKDGRYIYEGYFRKKQSGEFVDVLNTALLGVARQAGVEVE